jgi:molybdopterin/thiamine biosynthesis adenylyltransferase
MKNITIIGVGALGSHVAMLLRNEASLKLIDFDRVEAKNLASQFHGKPGMGKNKVQALAATMQLLWGLKVTGVPHKLTADNADQLLSGADLLLDCLDNGEARRIVQRYARAHGIPCVHGALAADGVFGQVVWDEKFTVDDAAPGRPTCEDQNFLPFIALVSSYIARLAQEFLATGRKESFWIPPFAGSIKM